MADAPDSKSGALTGVWVQVPSPVPLAIGTLRRGGPPQADRHRGLFARLTATRPPEGGLADPPVAERAMFAAYVLFSEKLKKRYAGSAEDPFRRLEQHNQGKSAFTSRGLPWALKYVEYYETRSEAAARERFLKSGVGRAFLDRLFRKEMGYPEKEIPPNCLRFELM